MWPRRCRRGRREGVNAFREGMDSFNVATTMSSWKTPKDQFVKRLKHSPLQCGHDDVVVEDASDGEEHRRGPGASMWPRRCRRGRLERAHRAGNVDTASMWPRRCRRGRRQHRSRHPAAATASMWPRRCRRGRLRERPQTSQPDCDASMWPRRCRRGRPTIDLTLGIDPIASMWPRRCRRGRRGGDKSVFVWG